MGRRRPLRQAGIRSLLRRFEDQQAALERGGRIASRAPERACEIGGPLRGPRGADRGRATRSHRSL